jgi:hypothetical protein
VRLALAGNKADAQAEEDVGQDGTNNGSLNDRNVLFASLEQDYKEDDFDDGSKGCFQDHGKRLVGHLAREFLASEAEQVGRGQHGNVARDEDGEVQFRPGEVLHYRESAGRRIGIDHLRVRLRRAP